MALTVSDLKDGLLAAFQSMTDGDDQTFADGVAAACKAYAESGKVTTADAGIVSAGTFTGAGVGSISCDDAPCAQAIMTACVALSNMPAGGDILLAAQLVMAIYSMLSAGEVNCVVAGTAITPVGAPVALSGAAKGTLTGIPAPMLAAFSSAFQTMGDMTEGGDEYLAAQMAAAVDAYLKAAAAVTQGQGPLAGSVGAGAMA